MPGPPLENEVMGWLLPAEGGSLGCVCVCNKPTPHEAIAFSHKGSSHSVAVWMMGQVGETSLPGRATAHRPVPAEPGLWCLGPYCLPPAH